MLKILVIDGQGGRVGKILIEKLNTCNFNAEIYGIGTNSIATSAMLKGGAHFCATGENAVVTNSKDSDLIVGPIGITITDALLGEVTKKMAVAVGRSNAQKVLLPINKCKNYVIGVSDNSLSTLIEKSISFIKQWVEENNL